MVILTDTNILIDYLRSSDKQHTLFHTLFFKSEYLPAVTFSIITKLWQGKSMNEKKQREFVEKLFEHFTVCSSNVEIAKKAGELIRKSNYHLSFQDAEIAAAAIYYNLPLLTRNIKDFKGIEGLSIFTP
jgi:predicted nucleic acid-binding protein